MSFTIALLLAVIGLAVVGINLCRAKSIFRLSKLSYLSPSFLISASLLFKVCIGTLAVLLFGSFSLPPGEYSQYTTTFRYSSQVSLLWIIFLAPSLLLSILANRCLRPQLSSVTLARNSNFSYLNQLLGTSSRSSLTTKVIWFTFVLGVLITLYTIVGLHTEALDRGDAYERLTQASSAPANFLTPLLRLKQLFYFLSSLLFLNRKNNITRFILGLAILNILLVSISGSRGEVFYPALMMLLPLLLRIKYSYRMFALLLVPSLVILVSLPYIAALRDLPSFKQTSTSAPLKRIKTIPEVLTTEDGRNLLSYRVSALGREIYGCSDSFLFTPNNQDSLPQGFRDLSAPQYLFNLLLPNSLLGSTTRKLDGGDLAQSLIGNPYKPNWFPCLTLPADLYRRGLYPFVTLGGILFYFVLLSLDFLWLSLLRRQQSLFYIPIILLTVSFVQLQPIGTVQESLWYLLWDLPKYLFLFLLLILASRLSRLVSFHKC